MNFLAVRLDLCFVPIILCSSSLLGQTTFPDQSARPNASPVRVTTAPGIYDVAAAAAVRRAPRPFSQVCTIKIVDGALATEPKVPPEDVGLLKVDYGDFLLVQNQKGIFYFGRDGILTDGAKYTDGMGPVNSTISGSKSAFQLTLQRNFREPNATHPQIVFTQYLPLINGTRGGRIAALSKIGFSLIVRSPISQARGPALVPGRANKDLVSIGSQDFSHFIQEHPQETRQFLRPILLSFNCEYLVGPSDWQLVQVLPDAFKPDEATVKEVKVLLDKLDSDSSNDREAASARLKEMGPVAAAILAAANPQSLSPEQAIRVANLCKSRLSDEQVSDLARNVDFLVDCLDDSRLAVRAAALEAFKKAVGHDVLFDLGIEDSAARSEAVERLRNAIK